MDRTIDLDGCLNFRDVGGYPTSDGRTVRWRQVFRSDALHHLTRQDVAQLRGEIGLGTVIDLRSTAELRSEGRGPLAQEPVAFHHLPLYDGEAVRTSASTDMTLMDRYFLLAEFAKQPIARVITTLAASDAPAVYHCASGTPSSPSSTAEMTPVRSLPAAQCTSTGPSGASATTKSA